MPKQDEVLHACKALLAYRGVDPNTAVPDAIRNEVAAVLDAADKWRKAQTPPKPPQFEYLTCIFTGATPDNIDQRMNNFGAEGWGFIQLFATSEDILAVFTRQKA